MHRCDGLAPIDRPRVKDSRFPDRFANNVTFPVMIDGASAATATVLLVVFGAMTVLMVETPNPDSPINTAEEALWWAIVTVTTVGYGDYYPITTLGRVVAVLLMVCGVGLFGSFAAYVSSLFVEDQEASDSRQHKANRRMMRHMIEQVSELQGEIESLRRELHDHRRELSERHERGEDDDKSER